MYRVDFSEFDPPMMHMEPGKSYYMDACNAGQYMIMARPSLVEYVDPHDVATGTDGILICRAGGIGDIVQCAALIRAVRASDPDAPIDFCCASRFADAIRFHPDVRKVVPYPLEVDRAANYKRVIWLENAVEFNEDDHMADCFLKVAGYDPEAIEIKDKRPAFYMPKRKVEVDKRTAKRRIGIQAKASARCRTSTRVGDYCKAFVDDGWEVYLFGAHNEATCDIDGVVNLCDRPMELWEAARWMQSCDAMLTQDSGLMHIAGALSIPCVALFSVIKADLRVRYSPFTIGIQARGTCAPCGWAGRGGEFPPYCPTGKERRCGVLDRIPFDLIKQQVEQVIEAKRATKKEQK